MAQKSGKAVGTLNTHILVRRRFRQIADLAMPVLLLLLMAYSLVGETAHEWIGLGLLALIALHLWLNWGWIKAFRKRKLTAYAIVQTIVFTALVVCVLGSMLSGIWISRHVFSGILPSGRNTELADTIHLLCAYWGFALMGIHLGMHIHIRLFKKEDSINSQIRACRFLAASAIYGAIASVTRDFWGYLFYRNHFFAVFGVPLFPYLLDYLFIGLLFVFGGSLLAWGLRLKALGWQAVKRADDVRAERARTQQAHVEHSMEAIRQARQWERENKKTKRAEARKRKAEGVKVRKRNAEHK